MAYFVVDLWLDGYDTEEEADEACEDFIKEQLDFSASSVHVKRLTDEVGEKLMKD